MEKNTQSGFSLVELLLVVTIISVIAALGIPSFQKGIKAADNGAAFAQMRVISTAQLSFFSTNSRFARLDELNTIQGGSFGNATSTGLVKGRFVYEMVPLTPDNTQLRDGYLITAKGTNGTSGVPVVWSLNQSGEIVQVITP